MTNLSLATDRAVQEMMAGAGGSYAVRAVAKYVAELKEAYGDKFDDDRALDDLIKVAEMCRREITKQLMYIEKDGRGVAK